MGGSVSNRMAGGVIGASIAGGGNSLGAANRIDANYGSIGGGFGNTIMSGSIDSTIGGGSGNIIPTAGEHATVLGGDGNLGGGYCSFAAGYHAQAIHDGSFVWADTTQGDYASIGDDQFCIRATGGVQLSPGTRIYCGNQVRQMLNLWGTNYGIGVQASTLYSRMSDGFAWYRGGGHNDAQYNSRGGTTLMILNNGGLTVNGTFVSYSDRNPKENFAAVSPREVLDKVTALPISRWNFKGDAATPHVGPMAQDLRAAFALGADDKHIATVDADGVALAEIQGLNQKLEAEVKAKDARIATLEGRLAELERAVEGLVQKRAD
jgi:hypothetical protein